MAWVKIWDEGEQDYYFYNNETGESTWEQPPEEEEQDTTQQELAKNGKRLFNKTISQVEVSY